MGLMKRGRDSLINGAIFGGVISTAIVFGDKVLEWTEGIIPEAYQYLGEWSIPIYIIAAGILAGYAVDRF